MAADMRQRGYSLDDIAAQLAPAEKSTGTSLILTGEAHQLLGRLDESARRAELVLAELESRIRTLEADNAAMQERLKPWWKRLFGE
jgi:hypothetical protein